jgi:ureidoacrylate peracid hydrolase
MLRPLAPISPARSAIIVVDVQNDFCHPNGAVARRGGDTTAAMAMIPTLQSFLDAGRSLGVKIALVQTIHTDETDSDAWTSRSGRRSLEICREGTWGAEFTNVGPAGPDDVVINKHRYSAFINTRLDSVLRTWQVDTLIMTGVSTNVCVESTARHGFMLDYHIVMATDCCAAYTQAEHDAAVFNVDRYFGRAATAADVIAAWQAQTLVASEASRGAGR